MSQKLRAAGIIRIITLFSAIFGTFSRIILSAGGSLGADVFLYFTVQSNILVVIYLLIETAVWLKHRRDRGTQHETPGHGEQGGTVESGISAPGAAVFHPAVHGAVLLYILITGIVFNTMLAGSLDSRGFDLLIIHVNHSFTPMLFFLDWFLHRPRKSHQWREIWLWLIYPIAYAVFGSIEGAQKGSFRYFFLDFTQPLGQYLLQLSSVILIYALVGACIIFINRRWSTVHTF